MRNIELKARLGNRAGAEAACLAIGARFQHDIRQIDTYFTVSTGRLKLREADPGPTELVYYERPDVEGPKGCDYALETVGPGIKPLLENALGVVAIIDKVRSLYLWDNVRIHLDEVRGLGKFIEFEAVMFPDDEDQDGFDKLGFLIETFEIADDAHEAFSYLELMAMESDR